MFDIGDTITLDCSVPIVSRSRIRIVTGIGATFSHGEKFTIVRKTRDNTLPNGYSYLISSNRNGGIDEIELGCDHFVEFWIIIQQGIFRIIRRPWFWRVPAGTNINRSFRSNIFAICAVPNVTFTTLEVAASDIYIPSELDLLHMNLTPNRAVLESIQISETMAKPKAAVATQNKHIDEAVNIFDKCKHRLIYISGYIKHNGAVIRYKNYGFELNLDNYYNHSEDLVALVKIDDKFVVKKFASTTVQVNVIDIAASINEILPLFKAKVINIDESCRLFMHNKRKKAMLEASTNGKTFSIVNYNYNYLSKKFNETHPVIELNDESLSLKFVLKDIEIILPNFNGYTLPKSRTISEKDDCIIVKDKRLPLKAGSKVKVVQILGKGKFNNSKKIVVQTENKETCVCRFRNLKKL